MMPRNPEQDINILTLIHEGMNVYDRHGESLGTVRFVQMGDDNPSTMEVETAGTSYNPERDNDNFLRDIAEALVGSDDLPEVLVSRMHRSGYVQVDTGLLQRDRYVLPEHISSVSDEEVHLRVGRDEVILPE